MAIGSIGSGLDTRSIVDQLVQVERQPIRALERRRADAQAQISALGRASADLRKVTRLATELGSVTSGLLQMRASSSAESVLRVRAAATAQPGTFDVQVQERARAAQMASDTFLPTPGGGGESIYPEVRAGTLEIAVSGEQAVTVELQEGWSLGQAAQAINSSGAQVRAMVVDTGVGQRLALSSLRGGYTPGGNAADALVVTETSTGSSGQALGLTTTVEARNARINVMGVDVVRRENMIDDVIPGVTLDLLATQGEGESVTVEIFPDTSGMVEKLEQMVQAYNNVVENIRNSENLPSVTRQAMEELRRVFTSLDVNQDGPRSLADIGITTNRDTGLLEMNPGLLGDALANNAAQVAAIFSRPSEGLATKAFALERQYTGSLNGLFANTERSLKLRTDSIAQSIERREAGLARYRASLQRQFTALETLMSRMQVADNAIASFVPTMMQPAASGSR